MRSEQRGEFPLFPDSWQSQKRDRQMSEGILAVSLDIVTTSNSATYGKIMSETAKCRRIRDRI
jgi:hypothetical protein